jgi:hypothetical protein
MSFTRVRARALLPVTVAPRRPETYETARLRHSSPPPPITTNARVLLRHAGPCPLCDHALLRGERVCELTATGRTVHVACAGTNPINEGASCSTE